MSRFTHQAALPGFELGDYIAESVDFLRSNEPPEGYFVGFSGGKDSITALNLCRIAGVKHQAFYSCTRIDPPEVVRFIKAEYPEVQWLYPKVTMWSGIMNFCPPYRNRRWCCDHLKKAPAKHHPLKHRVMGIRAEESVRRASRPRIDTFSKQTTYKAIFKWPEWVVWEFIESIGLAYPSLYDEGFHRIGCIICPFILGIRPGAIRQRELSMTRWPLMWKAYENAIKRWWISSTEQGPRYKSIPGETAETYWRAYLRGFSLPEDRAFLEKFHPDQLLLMEGLEDTED
jgi:phosphoadenosine phosphosulfate reductase